MNRTIALVGILVVGLIIGLALGYAAFHNTPNTTTGAVQTTQTPATGNMEEEKYENYTVKLAYNDKIGLYLVDSKGRTLYFFAKDYNGSSSCYGQCAQHWPAFYTSSLKVSPGLNPKDFGVITRMDGMKQLTYKGWPLYYYAGDYKPGDINGDGIKGVWFVAKPDYTVLVAVKPGLGKYLVDAYGRTLYIFAKDTNGSSTCYGMCAQKWPPFTPRSLVIPSTLNITDFSFIARNDGTAQLAYRGHPLYYWINDHARGDTTGNEVKNVWFVASINEGS